ncbi:MAG TPA: NAD(P)H-binding protein [Candidatus Acidoferrales bacterium]|jgi:putative NADH-flavin reductase|nr:NAD(P)H-binding protein [Candidatus Acidoferrales bacterium]
MRIGIIGASGNIGSRIFREAVDRGHEVVAFTRSGAAKKGTPWRDLDLFDLEALRKAVTSLDVLISSYQPGNATRDIVDAIQKSIADPTLYPRAAANLLKALESRPATRLIVVGGAANLEVAPGQTTDDDDAKLRQVLKSIGVPEDYVVVVKGHREALNLLRVSNRRWTYVSPSAEIRAGERTGRFRIGSDQLLVGVDGRSQISYEDFALAILDEIEEPRHIQRRFTVGY